MAQWSLVGSRVRTGACVLVGLMAAWAAMASEAVTVRTSENGLTLSDPATRLSLHWEDTNLVLRYWTTPRNGTLAIRQASDPGLLSVVEPSFHCPVPPTGEGSLILSNSNPACGGFFSITWDLATHNPNPEDWSWVPPGRFLLGSSEEELGHESDESPRMRVTLSRGFFMGRREVTQAEYLSLVYTNPSHHTNDLNLPVESVTWQQAVDYCALLTSKLDSLGTLPEGYACRLPTEAEWEYAARAGTVTRFCYGDDLTYTELPAYAWFIDNSEGVSHVAGLKQPNGWGLFDMHGNVGEWCSDWYAPYIGGFSIDSTSPSAGDLRVIRGSSYVDEGEYLRSAFRMQANLDGSYENVGFRVVLAATNAFRLSYPVELVHIPAGSFLMGSPDEEIGHQSDETPQMPVTITRDFYVGKYEVTQAQYYELMGTNPSFYATYPYRPVEQVNWQEANEFCARLNQREEARGALPAGWQFRLPTEAEWEYVARAGTNTRFSHGDDPDYGLLPLYAWFFVDGPPYGVGGKLPNAWGAYDMYGNVYEWCSDWYGAYPGGLRVDPCGLISGSYRVVRGGDSRDDPEFLRSACRMYAEPGLRLGNVGFRVVLARTSPSLPNPIDSLALVWLPPGTFEMGSPASERDRDSDEGPQSQVTISQGFWLGRYEVTQAQYTWLMETNPSFYSTALERPVERVTWEEAMEFCARLTAYRQAAGTLPAGFQFRLPTEAEWEYAARAGTTNRFGHGDDPDYEQLGLYARFMVGPTDGVGAHRPNQWGLYDLHGNVAEWCLDWYAPYSGKTLTDPSGPKTGAWRVNRGGGSVDSGRYCRSAARGGDWPGDRSHAVGFRVALAPVKIAPLFTSIPLVSIPAGSFLMGSPDSEEGREADEGPQTQVSLPDAFWMGQTEVTQVQYEAVMGTNTSMIIGFDDQPVEQVSWEQAVEFCARLTENERTAGRLPTGFVYRLPTEAEWEYAARAGTGTRFSYGDDPDYQGLGTYAWHLLSADFTTRPVATLPPNPWGLHDMYGNVAEWCHDWYADYPGGETINPTGPATGVFRVIRGGSYYDLGDACRSAYRLVAWTADSFYNVGFRVVLARPLPPAR